MKLRIRYRQTTQLLEIHQENEESFTVKQAFEDVVSLFATENLGSTDSFLSLNKKDPVGDRSATLRDCGVVSGDVLYLITSINEESVPSKKQNTGKEASNQLDSGQQKTNGQQSQPDDSGAENSNGLQKTCEQKTETWSNIPSTSTEENVVADGTLINTDEESDMREPVNQEIVNKCLSEPILCCESSEGRVPALLQDMESAMCPGDQTEAMCVVLHVLMLETGFIMVADSGVHNEGLSVPDNWRKPGHYKLTYTYKGCSDHTCLLTIIPTGLTLTLHGKISGLHDRTHTMSVKVSDYVSLQNMKEPENSYTNLSKLSRMFKDSIALPLVQDIRNAAGLEEIYGILALSQEIKLRMLSYLDVRSLLQLSQVCKELYDVCQDPYLWRRLYLKHFGNKRDNSLSQNWKQFYKQEHKIRRERRKLMSRMTMVPPPNWGPQNPFSGPSHWIPPGPGMIGGDYDLYPSFPGSLPGVPGRLGPRPPTLPRPRYDLIGPNPDLDPSPDPLLPPSRPSLGRGGMRNPFSGFGPRFF